LVACARGYRLTDRCAQRSDSALDFVFTHVTERQPQIPPSLLVVDFIHESFARARLNTPRCGAGGGLVPIHVSRRQFEPEVKATIGKSESDPRKTVLLDRGCSDVAL